MSKTKDQNFDKKESKFVKDEQDIAQTQVT